ncbi:anti-sigma factor [Aestuariibaculum sediminum]|uniref:Anti-sigma factor n=1 Tax=Aestuariibaculum sediminum TaxID=2770637 RepID=A0A8J6Q8Y8_9FLAO|nr:anti-sigma factor [Aestuariibaculum sediminum]MBD0833150.1 anti-sigma factor [Aestuariibaculum sediminum]
MDIKAYIESGILELYVAGALSEKENKEVYNLMLQYPEILQEVLDIEAAVIKLTASVSPVKNNEKTLQAIKSHLDLKDKNVKVVKMPRYNWVTYTGWAASVLLTIGLFWTLKQNNKLESEIQIANTQQQLLETQIANSKNSLEEANTLISVLRDNNITKVPLTGQGNFSNTYANVYWDKESNRIFLDAQGLPEPPEGKVYQVWSLTLNPLTPTSLGTIDNFISDNNKIFEIENSNNSEAFGITLEPAGGSETPTMEFLYTLGVVNLG